MKAKLKKSDGPIQSGCTYNFTKYHVRAKVRQFNMTKLM